MKFFLFFFLPLFAQYELVYWNKVLEGITSKEIREHVRFLTSPKLKGRRTTTKGAYLAAQYIAREFQRYGLLPGGDRRTFFQSFPLVASRKISVNLHLGRKKLQEGRDFLPFWYTGEGNFQGLLSRLQKRKETSPCLVVDLTHFHQEKKLPRRSLFRQILRLSYQLQKKQVRALFIEVGKLKRYRMPSRLFGRQMAPFPILFVKKGVLKMGKEVQGSVKVTFEKKQGRNVVAYLKGADPFYQKEIIVIGAHYDHLGLGGQGSLSLRFPALHPGADDNASGTAALLEIAEALSHYEGVLKRTIVFVAFSGEEEGLLGSAYFVKNAPFPLSQVVCMINLDMVGRMKDKRLIIGGAGTAKEWKNILNSVNRHFQFRLKLTASGFGPSDHASFYKKRIPVLHFFTGVHRDYHKPSDTWSKIRYRETAQIARFVTCVAATVSQNTRLLSYVYLPPRRSLRARQGNRPYFGIVPEYGEEGKGLVVGAVQKGSPAEKAGMKGGDVIVEMDGKRVRNIYDFARLLYGKKPGDKVKVVVLRKEKRLLLTVTLGKK